MTTLSTHLAAPWLRHIRDVHGNASKTPNSAPKNQSRTDVETSEETKNSQDKDSRSWPEAVTEEEGDSEEEQDVPNTSDVYSSEACVGSDLYSSELEPLSGEETPCKGVDVQSVTPTQTQPEARVRGEYEFQNENRTSISLTSSSEHGLSHTRSLETGSLSAHLSESELLKRQILHSEFIKTDLLNPDLLRTDSLRPGSLTYADNDLEECQMHIAGTPHRHSIEEAARSEPNNHFRQTHSFKEDDESLSLDQEQSSVRWALSSRERRLSQTDVIKIQYPQTITTLTAANSDTNPGTPLRVVLTRVDEFGSVEKEKTRAVSCSPKLRSSSLDLAQEGEACIFGSRREGTRQCGTCEDRELCARLLSDMQRLIPSREAQGGLFPLSNGVSHRGTITQPQDNANSSHGLTHEDDQLIANDRELPSKKRLAKARKKGLVKTKMCPLFKVGECKKTGKSCKYAHTFEDLRATEDMFKTKMCAFWLAGHCKAGPVCRHAHGEMELRMNEFTPPPPLRSGSSSLSSGPQYLPPANLIYTGLPSKEAVLGHPPFPIFQPSWLQQPATRRPQPVQRPSRNTQPSKPSS